MTKECLLFQLLLFLAPAISLAQVNRCVDHVTGHVTLIDTQCPHATLASSIDVKRTTTTQVAAVQDPPSEKDSALARQAAANASQQRMAEISRLKMEIFNLNMRMPHGDYTGAVYDRNKLRDEIRKLEGRLKALEQVEAQYRRSLQP